MPLSRATRIARLLWNVLCEDDAVPGDFLTATHFP
jgi:hypothetical protein